MVHILFLSFLLIFLLLCSALRAIAEIPFWWNHMWASVSENGYPQGEVVLSTTIRKVDLRVVKKKIYMRGNNSLAKDFEIRPQLIMIEKL